MACPLSLQSEDAPPAILNISHFVLDKSALHRRLSRQDVFFIYAGR